MSCDFLYSIAAASWPAIAGGLFGNLFGAPGLNAAHDYVVVGDGTAGNTIVTRLAQNCRSGELCEIVEVV